MTVTLLNQLRNLPGLSWSIYIVTISEGATLISDVSKKLCFGLCLRDKYIKYEADRVKGRDDMLWSRILQRFTKILTFS